MRTLKNKSGLTLIEVLIALAIVAIAMTAIIKATTQNIRATTYLQNKTIAMWVGQQILNEARANIIALPRSPDMLKEKTTMLGRDWYWQADSSSTPNKRIKKISVRVYTHDAEENETPLIALESYTYQVFGFPAEQEERKS
ncbi:MAG: hypothetical protein ACD_46C00245G0002 [uncultured bacterium]|nr:MAG: hypothetical protein ACD_46C00245G0002 [uncultured bacterium]